MEQNHDIPSRTFLNLAPEKRTRVLDESLREFADKGYQAASINRIAARLSIAKGSFFQYFGTKEGLFRLLFGRALDEIKAPLKAIRDAGGDEPFAARLRQVFVAGAAFARSHPLVWRIYRRMATQEDFPLREALLRQARAEALTYFRELVEAAQSRGEVRPEADPAVAAFLIEATLESALTAQDAPLLDAGLGLSGADEKLRNDRLAALAEMLCRGLLTH